MPKDNGKRVVAGARRLSPALGDRMMAAKVLGRSVVLRELMPQDLKLEIDRPSRDEADAPSWLWSSVVELASIHEAAHLEHCRQYALAQ